MERGDAGAVEPRELPLATGRTVYYGLGDGAGAGRLIGHIHGVCGGPPYACGKWIGAATERGTLVCPTGNTRCGNTASWEGPSWAELVLEMDRDLERSVARVMEAHPGAVASRSGAVLTGYSRGGYAVPEIARMHPGRWPLALIIEANVPLYAVNLRSAGVRRVVLVAAEHGAERAGMQRTRDQLSQAGFPVSLLVMQKSSHLYSEDMEDLMRRALAFLLEDGDAG